MHHNSGAGSDGLCPPLRALVLTTLNVPRPCSVKPLVLLQLLDSRRHEIADGLISSDAHDVGRLLDQFGDVSLSDGISCRLIQQSVEGTLDSAGSLSPQDG